MDNMRWHILENNFKRKCSTAQMDGWSANFRHDIIMQASRICGFGFELYRKSYIWLLNKDIYGMPKRILMLNFWNQKMISWNQKLINDIRKLISDIRKFISDIRKYVNFWYPKIFLLIMIFLYQKISLLVTFIDNRDMQFKIWVNLLFTYSESITMQRELDIDIINGSCMTHPTWCSIILRTLFCCVVLGPNSQLCMWWSLKWCQVG